MPFSRSIIEIIGLRYSCRNYLERPIEEETRRRLTDYLSADRVGPFGTSPRFVLVAATEEDRRSLRGLGTYGFIRGATGFIIGAMAERAKNLEDFGYLMERIILLATDLGLGTCWLGGTFTRSAFAARVGLRKGESLPAIASVGYIAQQGALGATIRLYAGSDRRLPWEQLFFETDRDPRSPGLGKPLSRGAAGAYALPLEMVRRGPSASNKQPWRVVKDGPAWHFYLQRTPRYRDPWFKRFMGIADMQRLDMGIAMCHFELTARELGLEGRWVVDEPGIAVPDRLIEYVVSWAG
jgi:hypothetical protein